jgi:hypothetical protein
MTWVLHIYGDHYFSYLQNSMKVILSVAICHCFNSPIDVFVSLPLLTNGFGNYRRSSSFHGKHLQANCSRDVCFYLILDFIVYMNAISKKI